MTIIGAHGPDMDGGDLPPARRRRPGPVHMIDPHDVVTLCGLDDGGWIASASAADVTCANCQRVLDRRLARSEREHRRAAADVGQADSDPMLQTGWRRDRHGAWRPK